MLAGYILVCSIYSCWRNISKLLCITLQPWHIFLIVLQLSDHYRSGIYFVLSILQNGYDAIQAQMMAAGYQGEWSDYQYAEQLAYSEQYLQQNMQDFDALAGTNMPQDPRFMTQEDKDRGLGSVFKRDDQRLQQLREKDAREKDPNFISESYSECYPGYQEYNHEIVDSDDEADLSKMDMGGRVSDSFFFKILFYLVPDFVVDWFVCLLHAPFIYVCSFLLLCMQHLL